MFIIHTTPLKFVVGCVAVVTFLALAHDTWGWWI